MARTALLRGTGHVSVATVAFALVALLFGGAEATSSAEGNAVWLMGYESDDKGMKAGALGVTAGIVITTKSFISASECPKPKEVLMKTVAAETAKRIRADMNIPLVVATTMAWGQESGCPDAVLHWMERARFRP